MNFVFYVNHDSEIFLFENLVKVFRLKHKINIIALLPENKKRINLENYSFFDKIQIISSLEYSKNIFRLLINYNRLKYQLNNLFHGQEITFICFEPYSLNSVYLLSYFKKNKTIIFSTNQLNSISSNQKINLLKSIIYSSNTLLVSKKILKYFSFKKTVYHSIDLKVNCNYYITFENTDFKNSISAQKKIKIKNHPAFYFRDLTHEKKKIHILIISLVNDLINDEYWDLLKRIINFFKNNNIQFIVKDHPSSIFSNNELISKLELNKNQHLDKNVHIEKYIMKNFSKIKCIYGPNTTALRSANFLKLNNICYQLIFDKREEYISLTKTYFDASETILVSNYNELVNYVKIFENKSNLYKTNKTDVVDYDFLFSKSRP